MTTDRRLQLAVANELARLPESLHLIQRFLAGQAIEPRRRHMAELVAEELLTNVVRHGSAGHHPRSIEIAVTVRPDAVDLVVTDDGVAFDPAKAPAFDAEAPIEARSAGGMGIHLVRSVARSLRHAHRDGRNVVEVTL